MPATGMKSYYDMLGVAKDATQDEIRKAYLKLAKQYHPDKTGGDKAAEQKLKQINMAYDSLKSEEKRAKYDEALRNPFQEGGAPFNGFSGRGASADAQGFNFTGSFEDIFGDLFGQRGSGRRPGPRPGNDIEGRVSVTLREVAGGSKKQLRVPRNEICGDCQGSGAAPGTSPEACKDCGGSGRVSQAQGAFAMSRACPRCRGAGRIIRTPCKSCHGEGLKAAVRNLTVTIPAGAEQGARLRLKGQGEASESGGPSGDLYVVVDVLPDPFFEREGSDLVCEVPVTVAQAILGAKVRVPTLSGAANLSIPAGVQSGATLRMRGQGLPAMGGKRKGDQRVRIRVETPVDLTKEQRELAEGLSVLDDSKAYPACRAFEKKLRGHS
ncbi:MAG: molecular chaperone DnaJ [Candidatus Hydrogenedentes bacterium]|nr:molecular chaperone DnaJ [Candidatus Hydrogenedentota bacterium]